MTEPAAAPAAQLNLRSNLRYWAILTESFASSVQSFDGNYCNLAEAHKDPYLTDIFPFINKVPYCDA